MAFASVSFTPLAQEISRDSLTIMESDALLQLLSEQRSDTTKANLIAAVFLEKVKMERDTLKMLEGYSLLARSFNSEKNIQYADSIILTSKNINTENYPGLGYLLKAREYNNIGDIKEATINFLKAYEYAEKNKNISHQTFILGRLIFLKSIWGDKKEALELQKKRHAIVLQSATGTNTTEDLKNELTSLFNFSFCYLNLKELDSAAVYAHKGLQKSNEYKGEDIGFIENYFKEILLEINYYNKNYDFVIKSADSLLAKIDYENYKESYQNIYYFKGLSLLEEGVYEKGILYLIKSDSIFDAENFQIKQPYQRTLYEVLLKHYREKNNLVKQMDYLNKLIVTDSILIKNYQYFEPNLIKNFETPKLIEEKQKLIENLTAKNQNKSNTIWWILSILAISLMILGYYYHRQQVYKKRFTSLLSEHENTLHQSENKTLKNKVSKKIIDSILEQLEEFEANKDYLKEDLTIQKLAKKFGTNYNYLSSVINFYKEKGFSGYINDLRVAYAFTTLKNNSKMRKYTIKALSKEFGFSSAESFSRAFYKKFGIYPSYYITELDKSENEV
ncbi:MAG: AraC family transcriptional regulator [Flavobacteriaceae bacterium]|nr:helix-turn-helix transcriptional regulator [Flavobacteriaceae bacterium]